MKTFYKLVTAAIKAVEAIKWIDMDSGQLEQSDKQLKYPCALIKFESNNSDVDESGSQQKDYTLTVRVAFDAVGSRTSADTPESVYNRSLAYFDTVESIYNAFQAVSVCDFTGFECISEGQEQRSDGLVVFKQVFKTSKIVFK